MKLFLTLLACIAFYAYSFAQTIGSKVTFTAIDGKTYTGTIKEINNNQYKVKYDRADFEAWLTRDQFKLLDNSSSNILLEVKKKFSGAACGIKAKYLK
jgi:hypothetical protein